MSHKVYCSLYPWVCKYGRFPVGHPIVFTENFDDINDRPYHGIIKCLVLPPKGLFHPVLPLRSGQKLLFPLCRTCAEARAEEECTHTDEDRAFWGAWPTCELYKALDLGYEVLKISEVCPLQMWWQTYIWISQVYHYNDWAEYDGSDESTGLFTRYINGFLKIKQEASGWPDWVKSEADKDNYIKRYKDNEGIDLDKDSIEKNGGLRTLAKLMLNSFW